MILIRLSLFFAIFAVVFCNYSSTKTYYPKPKPKPYYPKPPVYPKPKPHYPKPPVYPKPKPHYPKPPVYPKPHYPKPPVYPKPHYPKPPVYPKPKPHYPDCYVKKISREEYYRCSYGKKAIAQKHYNYCRKLKYYKQTQQSCPNYNYGYKIFDRYCPHDECYGVYYYGKSKCHGKVKLSYPVYHYGKECKDHYEGKYCQRYVYKQGGYIGYKSYNQKFYSQCYCYTTVCTKVVETCYAYGGYYYKDHVKVKVPCGCDCYKKNKQIPW